MSNELLFDVWRGAEPSWARSWTKAALFATLEAPETIGDDAYRAEPPPWAGIDTSWAPEGRETALIVDLPGGEAVLTAIALVPAGFRPVVAINTTTGGAEVVEMGPVIAALRDAARRPHALDAPPQAPPAFVLDARRMLPDHAPIVGRLDNRWMLFASDLPSAGHFRANGIGGVLAVHRAGLAPDLVDVLGRFERGGLRVQSVDLEESTPTAVELPAGRTSAVGSIVRGVARWFELGGRRGDGTFSRRIVPRPSHG